MFSNLKLSILAAALLAAAALPAQNLFPIKTYTDSVRFRVGVAGGRVALEWQGRERLLERKFGDIRLTSLALDDADFVLGCEAPGLQRFFSFNVSMSLRQDGSKKTISPTPSEMLDAATDGGLRRTISWMDVLENQLLVGEAYTLFFKIQVFGPVDCEAGRPVFSLKKQLPYHAVGAAGLVTAGVGLLELDRSRRERDSNYDIYRSYWAEGRSEDEANDFLKKANDANGSLGRALLIAGLSVVALDAVFFTAKMLKIRKKQRVFDEHCQPSTTLLWEARPTLVGAAPGVGFSLKF